MHQPNFLPYAGFFDKIKKSDMFIIVDHCTFSKGKDNWHHRNRIRTSSENGWDYVTIPVSEHYNWKPFHEVKISDCSWFRKKKHLKTMEINYHKAEHFDDFFRDFADVYNQQEKDLGTFNTNLILWFLEKFRIKTKVMRSNDMDFNRDLRKDDMIIELMEKVNGTHFLSGDGAKCYVDPEKYKETGIDLEFQNFHPVPYPQVYQGFIPYLSVFDMLMNTGQLITNGKS